MWPSCGGRRRPPRRAHRGSRARRPHRQALRRTAVHMVPGRVLPVDSLPLTVNGKLDRKALTERAAQQDGPPDAPGGSDAPSALTALVGIFAETLPGASVDADTDFFGAGGDSIVAIAVINWARALGLPIAPRDVFLLRTPRALTGHLATHAPGPPRHHPPAARTARCRSRPSSCAGVNWADHSPGSPRPGRWPSRRAPASPTSGAPRTPSWPRTRPSGCGCTSNTVCGPCAPTPPVRPPSPHPAPPTRRPRRTRPPDGSTPRPEKSSRSPGSRRPAPWSSPSTTSPSTRCPG
ncbi:Carrier domain-containing protein OS=Streptomyces microflavus OX=1919 GN=Smic_00950 PE=4 SV=1 [Streptomyces microflavus]